MRRVFRKMCRIAVVSAIAGCGATFAANPATPQTPCTCRAAGASYALDACTCLATPNGPRIACCGKVLNNTAWRFSDRSCPLAAGPATVPPDDRAAAVARQSPWLAATAE